MPAPSSSAPRRYGWADAWSCRGGPARGSRLKPLLQRAWGTGWSRSALQDRNDPHAAGGADRHQAAAPAPLLQLLLGGGENPRDRRPQRVARSTRRTLWSWVSRMHRNHASTKAARAAE